MDVVGRKIIANEEGLEKTTPCTGRPPEESNRDPSSWHRWLTEIVRELPKPIPLWPVRPISANGNLQPPEHSGPSGAHLLLSFRAQPRPRLGHRPLPPRGLSRFILGRERQLTERERSTRHCLRRNLGRPTLGRNSSREASSADFRPAGTNGGVLPPRFGLGGSVAGRGA